MHLHPAKCSRRGRTDPAKSTMSGTVKISDDDSVPMPLEVAWRRQDVGALPGSVFPVSPALLTKTQVHVHVPTSQACGSSSTTEI